MPHIAVVGDRLQGRLQPSNYVAFVQKVFQRWKNLCVETVNLFTQFNFFLLLLA